ncbi:hypothetical protein [Aliarcobacter butzleri]|uniref:hypothetical protein n=1 Tax=Aliarcobacter butzleri TaxID=28197 RepID=UPI00263E7C13|nr:hypothetical protein [Aliarcobacter butzleri]MDN5091633.1 hypothetical protein [Aliarcobacter butzleri]
MYKRIKKKLSFFKLSPSLFITNYIFQKILRNNCWIANVVIMPEVSIGNNVIIGAGSIVTKSFPSNCVIAGNPAKIIRELNVKN